MNLKRSLHLSLLLLSTLATAAAEVPSLINYQGRLVNADGSAQSGQKSFLLQVFGAASGGSLLYREEIGNITLGEGGVYSFQFGGSGTSNAQITETIGTGGEAVLYQQVLSNLPVVAGSVSVSDGTYTWSQENGSSNEDDFSAAFSTNLNRITVNYFSGAPNDGRSIDVTYRYQAEGITGALSSGSEHWLQLTIDGDVQATRERVLAVPFAMASKTAQASNTLTKRERKHVVGVFFRSDTSAKPFLLPAATDSTNSFRLLAPLYPQSGIRRITKIEFTIHEIANQTNIRVEFSIRKRGGSGSGFSTTIQSNDERLVNVSLPIDLPLDFSDGYYTIELTGSSDLISPITLTVEEWGD